MRHTRCIISLTAIVLVLVTSGLANDANFIAGQFIPTENTALRLQAIDMDGNGHVDLVSSVAHVVGFQIRRNSGTGVLDAAVHYDVPGSLRDCADLDRDGDIDVVCLSYENDTTWLGIVMNNGDMTFQEPVAYPVTRHCTEACAVDFNGDSYPDIAIARGQHPKVALLFNNGDGTFQDPVEVRVTYDSLDIHYGIIGADLDADGSNDLVVSLGGGGTHTDSVSVLLNNGDGTFKPFVPYVAGIFPRDIIAVDLDNDGDLDMATASQMSRNISILVNNGDGTFETHNTDDMITNTYYLAAADLDNDGDVDIAAVGSLLDRLAYFYNDGSANFASPVIENLTGRPQEIVAADFDEDGDYDIAYPIDNPLQIVVLNNNTIGCCGRYTGGYTGNVDFDTDGKRNLGDVTRLIDRVYLTKTILWCEADGNVDGDSEGNINLADITTLVDHVYLSRQPTSLCQ